MIKFPLRSLVYVTQDCPSMGPASTQVLGKSKLY